MTIERRDHGNGRIDLVMLECIYCGEWLGENGKFPQHWRGDCPENPANQGD